MSELSGAAILLLILLGGSALGVFVRRFLSERHRSPETNDLIRLVVTMLVTFAALVLGLLTSSVKASFDAVDTDLRGVAIQLIQLDRSLRIYGSETLPARILLRSYTAAKIAATWADEPAPPGNYYPKNPRSPSGEEIENTDLGRLLTELETDLRDLRPLDPMHRQLSLTILNQFELLMRMRWKVIEESAQLDLDPLLRRAHLLAGDRVRQLRIERAAKSAVLRYDHAGGVIDRLGDFCLAGSRHAV